MTGLSLFHGSVSSLLSRCKSIRGLYDACTIKPRQLKGLQSLAISLGRIDVAADLSWVENFLKSKQWARRACRPQPPPLEPREEGTTPSRNHDGEGCDSLVEGMSPHAAENKGVGKTAENKRGPGESEGTAEVTTNGPNVSENGGVTDGNIERAKRVCVPTDRETSAGADSNQKLGEPMIGNGQSNPGFENPIVPGCTSGDHAQHAEKLEAVDAAEAVGGAPTGVETPAWSDSTTTPPSIKPPGRTATPLPPAALASTLDARLVPLYATLSVGVFTLVCNDDRAEEKDESRSAAGVDEKSAAGLGKLEIFGGDSNGSRVRELGNMEPSVAAPADGTAAAAASAPAAATAAAGGAKTEESSLQNHALTMSWETVTVATDDAAGGPRLTVHNTALPESSVLGLARLKLARFFRDYFARRSVRCSVPTGGRASVRLGEMQIKCRPPETVAERGDEQSPTSLWCVVVRNFSAIPVIDVVQPNQKQKQQRQLQLHMPTSKRSGSGGSGSGGGGGVGGGYRSDGGRKPGQWLGDSNAAAAAPSPRKTPPPLPPRPLPPRPPPPPRQTPPPRSLQSFLRSLRRFRRWGWRRAPRERQPRVGASPGVARFRVPEVQVHASSVTGGVNAGLAGWLNLRGLHEAEGLVATERRIAKLIAAGERGLSRSRARVAKFKRMVGLCCWPSHLFGTTVSTLGPLTFIRSDLLRWSVGFTGRDSSPFLLRWVPSKISRERFSCPLSSPGQLCTRSLSPACSNSMAQVVVQ